jgi:hypothetical protein
MALTITQQGPGQVPGAAVRKTFTMAGDAAYPNPAGYVVTAALLGLQRITKIESPNADTVASGAWDPVVVPTYASDGSGNIVSFALHLVVQTTGVEVANGVNVANANFLVNVEGN